MKKTSLIVSLILCFISHSFAQTSLSDSIKLLYSNYAQLQSSLADYAERQEQLERLLKETQDSILKLTNRDLISQKEKLEHRVSDLKNTAIFIDKAKVSLNSIKSSSSMVELTNNINQLNNPTNDVLGFKLQDQIWQIIDATIIKNRTKVNGYEVSKLQEMVNATLSSPLGMAISSVPIVSSIQSVFTIMSSIGLKGSDIDIADVEALKSSLQIYFNYYEQLNVAQSNFDQTLRQLNSRKESIEEFTIEFALERANNLRIIPIVPDSDMTLTQLTINYYSPAEVASTVDSIKAYLISNNLSIDSALSRYKKSNLYYPWGYRDVQYIQDEIKSLGEEYKHAYVVYQKKIKEVLVNNDKIGNGEKRTKMIADLDSLLNKFLSNYEDSLGLVELEKSLKMLESKRI